MTAKTRRIMTTKTRLYFLSSAAVALLVVLGTVTYRTLPQPDMGANILEGLIYFDILPDEEVTVNAGESITFTADGNFGTTTMPIKADWFIPEGENLGELSECNNAKKCTFTAGEGEGVVTIQADMGGGELTDQVQITIIEGELVNPFTDELPEWAKEAILTLHRMGIIKGYEDGRYGPADPVTRGQVITLLHRILVHKSLVNEQCGGQSYDDVPPDHYAYVPACEFKRSNWSGGGQFFDPDIPAPRGVTAAFVNRVFGATLMNAMNVAVQQGELFFDDVPVNHVFYMDTAITNVTQIMTGYPNGDFGVDDNLNRAEVAVVMYRLLNKVEGLGINELIAYEGEVPDDGPQELPKGACYVTRAGLGAPDAHAAEVGDGFAKLHIFENMSFDQVRNYCTDQKFGELMDSYCAHGQNSENQVYWNVVTFKDNGDVHTGGPAASGIQAHECPQAQLPKGACYITRAGLGAPDAHAAEIGDGFAKLHIFENLSYTQVRSYCTDQRFDQLMESFCAHGQNSSTPVYWNVVTFKDNGDVHTGGPAASGIQSHDCPVDEQEPEDSGPADCMGSSSNSGNSCSDSDGGKDYFVKGTVHTDFATGVSFTRTDSCRSGKLREWCCRPDGTQSFWDYDCPNGCLGGVCVGGAGGQDEEEEDDGTVSCLDLSQSAFTYPDTDGNKTVYFKSYGIYLCTAGNDTALEIEPQNSGSNYPKISGNYVVYFKSYGIKLYNIARQQKSEVTPANSGSNKPDINSEYVAYFKSYGIYLHHIESQVKAEIEPPNSGCNDPQFSGNNLNYTCNGASKTLSLIATGTPTDYILPRDCVGNSSYQGNSCTDSDGGYNPGQRGTGQANYATGVSYPIAEECRSGKLREWCCAPNGTPAFFDMTCPNGCSGGVCQ